jgi:photosystem II stability/assembly factor-like uncharacterized protein
MRNLQFFRLVFIMLCLLPLIANAQWQRQRINTTAGFRGLAVVDDNIVWASGTGGTVIRTTDGGSTWRVITVPGAEKLDFRDIEAFDADNAYILSIGNGENSRIYKTTDGGATWKLQFTNKNEKAFFDAIACRDSENCVAMSDPVDDKYLLISTSDGGATWSPMPNETMPAAKPGEAAFAASGTCLIRVGKKDIYIVTGGTDARVFHSDDDGQDWTVTDTPFEKGSAGLGIFSIAMRDGDHGIIVGGNYEKPDRNTGNLAFTKNGGKTWTAGVGLSGYRSAVAYINKDNVIAVGTNGSDLSIDGGKKWTRLDGENYNAVQAHGTSAIWAVGPNGMVAKLKVKKKMM